MTLIDGRELARTIREEAARQVADAAAAPVLAALVATDDPATAWYLGSLERAGKSLGIEVREARVEPAPDRVTRRLGELSADPGVHGILCLTPLPAGISLAEAGELIDPAKDVDGAAPESLGRLTAGIPAFAPATAQAVLELLRHQGTPLAGARAVIVGRSTVVGKPLALLLLAENATVTLCHTKTRNLAAETSCADVLVAAAGSAHLIRAAHVKAGAIVVDVGTNETADGEMVGDVDTASVEPIAAAVTPVPGGVGPVTTAVLLRNVVTAALAAG